MIPEEQEEVDIDKYLKKLFSKATRKRSKIYESEIVEENNSHPNWGSGGGGIANQLFLDYNQAINSEGDINLENLMRTIGLPLPLSTYARMLNDLPK